jgi:hypothetical protein
VAGNALIKEHNLQVDFSFNTAAMPGKQVAGYRLYKEGDLVCETGPVTPQSISCTITSITGAFDFSLSAFYDDGSESPQSSPFSVTIVDESSPLLGLQALTGQSPSGIGGLGTVAGNATVDLADVIQLLRNQASL